MRYFVPVSESICYQTSLFAFAFWTAGVKEAQPARIRRHCAEKMTQDNVAFLSWKAEDRDVLRYKAAADSAQVQKLAR